jgi:hypothetical protein
LTLQTIISKDATSRVLSRDSNVFVHPRIPRDKLSGAMSTFVDRSVDPNDIVLLLDDTIFGSAKDGLVLTETTLYIREKFCEPAEYDFADISSISLRSEFLANVLYIDDVRVAALSQPSKDTLIALCLIINTYLKQFQVKADSGHHSNMGYGSAPRQPMGTADSLRTFEICMITADILTHFALFNDNQWRPEKLQVINEMLIAFKNQPYLYNLLQERLDVIEPPPLVQSIDHFMRHEPPEEIKFELMWQAFQILAQDDSDLMGVESLVGHFALLLKVPPSIIREFCQELRQRLGYGTQTHNNSNSSHAQTTHSDLAWACQILEVDQRSSTRDAVQQAYRNKIRDFHPDKHQSLPQSVRQLVEGKAQELNQAREILLAHFQ